MLRDLRGRVEEVERVVAQELDRQRERWDAERRDLIRTAQENIDQVGSRQKFEFAAASVVMQIIVDRC